MEKCGEGERKRGEIDYGRQSPFSLSRRRRVQRIQGRTVLSAASLSEWLAVRSIPASGHRSHRFTFSTAARPSRSQLGLPTLFCIHRCPLHLSASLHATPLEVALLPMTPSPKGATGPPETQRESFLPKGQEARREPKNGIYLHGVLISL